MRDTIRKVLRDGCIVVFSSILLCSCSNSALSAPVILTEAMAQKPANEETMPSQDAASPAPEKTDGSTMIPTESITPVSAIDVVCHPCGAAVMSDGSLLVADVYNRVIWHVADGTSTVYAGSYSVTDDSGIQPPGGYNDASYKDSTFRTPWAIAPFRDGWAVSDTENHVIRLLQDGTVQTINARNTGSQTVSESGTVFEHPTGLASDDSGNLYVADTFADTIYRITPDGEIMTEVTGISEPMGMCWRNGSLYVAESGKNRVVSVKDGEMTALAGTGEAGDADGPAETASFSSPQGVAAGDDGTIYVADTDNSAIRTIRNGQVSTLYARDVRDLDAFFPVTPTGMLIIGDDLYVCDPFARTLLQLPLSA